MDAAVWLETDCDTRPALLRYGAFSGPRNLNSLFAGADRIRLVFVAARLLLVWAEPKGTQPFVQPKYFQRKVV